MSKITTCVLFAVLVAAGCGRSSNTTATGTSLDNIAAALKGDYYFKTPKAPAYFPGEPAIISAAHLGKVPSFVRAGIILTNANFSFCNLSPAQWTVLRAEQKPVYLVAWSSIPDSRGEREVATVDLNTDVFELWTCNATRFTNHLTQMESIIRKGTGQADFSMGINPKP